MNKLGVPQEMSHEHSDKPPRASSQLKFGLRTRLFLIPTLVITLSLFALGAFLEHSLRVQIEQRIAQEIITLAIAGKNSTELLAEPARASELQPLATGLAQAAHARVTILDELGTVLGDSDAHHDQRAAFDREAYFRECSAALSNNALDNAEGAFRTNKSVELGRLFAAARFQRGAQHGVCCVSLPLHEADLAVRKLRVTLGISALLVVGLSALVSFASAHFVARTIRDLFAVAGALVRVEPSHREQLSTGDEIGELAGSINEMAQTFRETVGTLAQERDRFGAVLEGMGEALVALDGEGKVTLCNRSALELLQWSESMVGRTLLEAIRQPALHDLVQRAIAQRASDNEKSTQEVEVETQRGTRLLARATRLTGPGGGVVLVLRDVTELRRLENVRRDFVANVSHELRTPVSTIRATAEALVEGALGDKEHAMRFSRALLRNAERLSRIIADLLNLSRIEAGEQPIEIQPVAIASSVHRALDIVSDTANKRGISLTVDVENGLTVHADEAAFDHVALNLLDNAVKYTSEGGHVHVHAERRGERVRIEVRDDGPGVAERHRERIFERFYRVDKGRSRDLGGTGLGLAIVRHLMEAMHGTAGFSPNTPHGSVFWLDLPCASQPSTRPEVS